MSGNQREHLLKIKELWEISINSVSSDFNPPRHMIKKATVTVDIIPTYPNAPSSNFFKKR